MQKILIANRGEIALRIMRTIREMGLKSVAVYSDVDRNAPFVRFADEAVNIGAAPSSDSYLRGDKIIEVAKTCSADAIHPAYGFLAENADFARKVKAAGLTLIGPSPEAMEVMGSKLAAKAAVKEYDIPLIPGTEEAVSDVGEAEKIAVEIGFPILVKASAGGGGKGMRIVEKVEDFKEQMDRAVSEAISSFGDGAVFIERFVNSPRHIEIQILADSHGNIVHLFERECSIQRRHQKVIEEAPSSVLTEALRKEMGEAAIKVAKSCNYVGAGTVEFLLDENLNFYFLEMNTRLQVEHPITEQITGVDLVKEQINIAKGEKLSFTQEDLKINGHAFEVRVYAEDPMNNFLPDIGNLKTYVRPQGLGIRVDDGFEEGMDIPIYYDPMIAKLISFGKDREEARKRMLRAIDEFHIGGVKTTLNFCRYTLNHEAFVSGNFDTNFVKNHFKAEDLETVDDAEAEIAVLISAQLLKTKGKQQEEVLLVDNKSKWKANRR